MATRIRVRSLALAFAVLLALGAAGVAAAVALGLYNVGASQPHWSQVYRLLDYALYESVKAHAQPLQAPPLDDPARIRAGAVHYRAHCLACHGAPGVAPERLAYGMQPAPVNLVPAARHWQSEELHWVIKHGIKMSGMPGWTFLLSDAEIWEVVAFVQSMRTLSPPEYARLARSLPPQDGAPAPAPERAAADGAATPLPVLRPPVLGRAEAGRLAVQNYLCATCHQIPGVVGANRHVGPPLNGIGKRRYIAGILRNTPQNMVHFLMQPKRFAPDSAMPNLGVTEQDARDMAAYLYTLESVE